MHVQGKQTIENKSNMPIETLYVNLANTYKTTLDIPKATLDIDDKRLSFQIYRLQPAL